MTRARREPRVLFDAGDLVVERDPGRPTGRLLRQRGMEASYVDLADPTHLEFGYLRWIRIVLRVARARRVLHIGGAGCALARALAAEDPGSRQEVVEVDAEVLAVAREHLGLRRRPGLRVRLGEGRAALGRQPSDGWDAVVLDAFVAARVPPHLITAEALGEIARVAPLVLVNVVDNRSGGDVRAVGAAAQAAFPRVGLLGGRAGNSVVIGCRRERPLDLGRVAALVAADAVPARLRGPAELGRLLSGAPALRDSELGL